MWIDYCTQSTTSCTCTLSCMRIKTGALLRCCTVTRTRASTYSAVNYIVVAHTNVAGSPLFNVTYTSPYKDPASAHLPVGQADGGDAATACYSYFHSERKMYHKNARAQCDHDAAHACVMFSFHIYTIDISPHGCLQYWWKVDALHTYTTCDVSHVSQYCWTKQIMVH